MRIVAAVIAGKERDVVRLVTEASERTSEFLLNDGGRHVLHTAAHFGKLRVAKWLAARMRGPWTMCDALGWLPIHYAAQAGHLDVVQYSVKQDRETRSARDIAGWQPIHVAAQACRSDVVQWLVLHDGVDPAAVTSSGQTPAGLVPAHGDGAAELVAWLTDRTSAS